jgi:hypothetical protein
VVIYETQPLRGKYLKRNQRLRKNETARKMVELFRFVPAKTPIYSFVFAARSNNRFCLAIYENV